MQPLHCSQARSAESLRRPLEFILLNGKSSFCLLCSN
jgi:hypothetical protein